MDSCPAEVLLYQGCCLYYLQMYKQAAEKVDAFSAREEELMKKKQERALLPGNVMERKRELQRERSKSERMAAA